MKTKIYLSGSISDDPDYYQRFHDKEQELKLQYDEVFNPAKLDAGDKDWWWYLRRDCNIIWNGNFTHIYMMKGYKEGSEIELIVSKKLKLQVVYEED